MDVNLTGVLLHRTMPVDLLTKEPQAKEAKEAAIAIPQYQTKRCYFKATGRQYIPNRMHKGD
jgi:hypothetical protein